MLPLQWSNLIGMRYLALIVKIGVTTAMLLTTPESSITLLMPSSLLEIFSESPKPAAEGSYRRPTGYFNCLNLLTVELMTSKKNSQQGAGSHEDRGDSHLGFEFYSENHDQLAFDTAEARLNSPAQKDLIVEAESIDEKLGLDSYQVGVVGDTRRWGAENSVFDTIENAPDYETVRYSAARKGQLAHQDSVIPFYVHEDGADALYQMKAYGVDIHRLREWLDAEKLDARSFVPVTHGAEIVIFDKGKKLREKVKEFCDLHGLILKTFYGQGEFLDKSNYEKVIKEFESRR